MLEGELVVVSANAVVIDLKRTDHPEKVRVHFTDDPVVIPCNPADYDDLQWSVSLGTSGTFSLTISWKVSGLRNIKWEALW